MIYYENYMYINNYLLILTYFVKSKSFPMKYVVKMLLYRKHNDLKFIGKLCTLANIIATLHQLVIDKLKKDTLLTKTVTLVTHWNIC